MGYRTTIASVVLAALLLVGDGFWYSFSKINHTSVASMLPILLTLAGWGNRWSLDAVRGIRATVRAWPLALLALMIGLALFTAGWPKLATGWLDTTHQATRLHFLGHYLVVGHDDLMAPALFRVTAPWYWEAMDWATVGFELALLPAVFAPRLFRALLVVIVSFHLGVFLICNIAFSAHTLAYAPFAPWSSMFGRAFHGAGRRPRGPTPGALAAGGIALGVVAYHVPSGVRDVRAPGWPSVYATDVLWLSAAALVLALIVGDRLARSRRGPDRSG